MSSRRPKLSARHCPILRPKHRCQRIPIGACLDWVPQLRLRTTHLVEYLLCHALLVVQLNGLDHFEPRKRHVLGPQWTPADSDGPAPAPPTPSARYQEK